MPTAISSASPCHPRGTNDPPPATSYTYESDGDVATMTLAGNTVTYGYDGHGNRILERDS